MSKFLMKTDFVPSGDQPKAINELTAGLKEGEEHQVLLGVTGSGKDIYHRPRHRARAAPRADYRAQQNAGRAALRRIQKSFPGQRRGVFCQLL